MVSYVPALVVLGLAGANPAISLLALVLVVAPQRGEGSAAWFVAMAGAALATLVVLALALAWVLRRLAPFRFEARTAVAGLLVLGLVVAVGPYTSLLLLPLGSFLEGYWPAVLALGAAVAFVPAAVVYRVAWPAGLRSLPGRPLLPLAALTGLLALAAVILWESSRAYQGLGLPPPYPSWGRMLAGGAQTYAMQAPWMLVFPGLALVLTWASLLFLNLALVVQWRRVEEAWAPAPPVPAGLGGGEEG